jgi:hypothetical protein
MDVDLVIYNILQFLPRNHRRACNGINRRWYLIINDIYPITFIWKENSEVIQRLSKTQKVVFPDFNWINKHNQVICYQSGLTIYILRDYYDKNSKFFIVFEDLLSKNRIGFHLPHLSTLSVRLFHFWLPKFYSIDNVDHYVVLLKYDDPEHTFIDYTDLEHIQIFKNYDHFINNFSSTTAHYAICFSSALYDFYLGNTTLADFPIADKTKLSFTFESPNNDKYSQMCFLNGDGSIFVIPSFQGTISLYKNDTKFETEAKQYLMNTQCACSRFVFGPVHNKWHIYDIYLKELILEIEKSEENYICSTLTLTHHHFIFLAKQRNTNGDHSYYLVDGNKRIFKEVYYPKVFFYSTKVEQINDHLVIIHWNSISKVVSIGVDLNKLCLIDNLKDDNK